MQAMKLLLQQALEHLLKKEVYENTPLDTSLQESIHP